MLLYSIEEAHKREKTVDYHNFLYLEYTNCFAHNPFHQQLFVKNTRQDCSLTTVC